MNGPHQKLNNFSL